MMKVKVMIIDGIIDSVLMDNEAINANIDVEIVDYDKNSGNSDRLEEEFREVGMSNGLYNVNHCE